MGEILESLAGMGLPLVCRPFAVGAGGFRVWVPANTADVEECTVIRTDRFIEVITDGPPIKRRPRRSLGWLACSSPWTGADLKA